MGDFIQCLFTEICWCCACFSLCFSESRTVATTHQISPLSSATPNQLKESNGNAKY